MDEFWDKQFTANPINFQVSPYVSRDVLTADDTGLELLSLTDSLSPGQKTNIATALEAPPKYKLVVLKNGNTLQQAEYVLRVSGISGAQEDLQTLQEGKWVTDNLLNMFLRKYVQEQIQGVHCYFICFMQMMLKEGKSGLIYDYNAVQDVMPVTSTAASSTFNISSFPSTFPIGTLSFSGLISISQPSRRTIPQAKTITTRYTFMRCAATCTMRCSKAPVQTSDLTLRRPGRLRT